MNSIYFVNEITKDSLVKSGFSIVDETEDSMAHIDFEGNSIACTFTDEGLLDSVECKGINPHSVFEKLCASVYCEFLDEDAMGEWIHSDQTQTHLFRKLLVKSRNSNLNETNRIFDKDSTPISQIYDVTKNEAIQFSLNGIRAIAKNHVTEIYNAIDTGTLFLTPIEVNINTLNILDGQHRFESYKKLWETKPNATIRVIFIDVPVNQESQYVEDKNTHNKNWAIKDFKKLQETQNNSSVLLLDQFALSHDRLHGKTNKKTGETPIYIRYAMAFLLGENQTKELKSGSIKITQDDVDTGNALYDEIDRIIEALGLENKGNWFEAMVQAWYAIRTSNQGEKLKFNKWLEKYTFEEFLKSLPENFNKEASSSKQEYISKFLSCKNKIKMS